MSRTFSDIIELFGVGAFAAAIGKPESHVRAMKARDSVPPDYWPQLIEAAPRHGVSPAPTYPELVALRNERAARKASAAEHAA